MDQVTVLIISEDPEFSRAITAPLAVRAQHSGLYPDDRGSVPGHGPRHFAVAIVGAVRAGLAAGYSEPSNPPDRLSCWFAKKPNPRDVREAQPRIMVLRQHEAGWMRWC